MNIGGLGVFCLGLIGASLAHGLSFEIAPTYKRGMYGTMDEEGVNIYVTPSGLPVGYELENAFGDVSVAPAYYGRGYDLDKWKEDSGSGWKLRSVAFPGETKNVSIAYDDFEVSVLGLDLLKRSATAATALLWGDLLSGPITLQVGYYTDTEFVNVLSTLAPGTTQVEVNIPARYNAAWIHVSRYLTGYLNPYRLIGEEGETIDLPAERGTYWQLGTVSWDQEGWANEPVTSNHVPDSASSCALFGSVLIALGYLRRFRSCR